MKKDIQLDKDPIRPLFFTYYIPALTSMLSITLHQVVDGIILGQYVGESGVAAVGIFGSVVTFFIAFMLTLVVGGGILIGKHIGAKHPDRAQEVFSFMLTYTMLFGVLVLACAPFIAKPLVVALAGDESTALFQNTYDYTFWGLLWVPFFLLRMLFGNVISHDGAPKISRNATVFAALLNIVLDVLLVMVIPLGTKGASIATGIAVLASVIYLWRYIRSGKGHLRLKHFVFTFQFGEWKKLFHHGVPSFTSEISFALGLLLMNNVLVAYGAEAVAVFGMLNYLSFIFLRLFTAAMVSFLPIAAYNIGASLVERVFAVLKFSLYFTLLLGMLVSVIGFAFPDFIISVFATEASDMFRAIGENAFGLFFLLFLAAGPNYILGAYLQSIGKSAVSITLNVLKGLGLIAVFLFLLPKTFGLGLEGVWLSRSLAEIGALVLIALWTVLQPAKYYSKQEVLRQR